MHRLTLPVPTMATVQPAAGQVVHTARIPLSPLVETRLRKSRWTAKPGTLIWDKGILGDMVSTKPNSNFCQTQYRIFGFHITYIHAIAQNIWSLEY